MINADASLKSVMYEKKNMFGILVHVFVKIFRKYYGLFRFVMKLWSHRIKK